MLREWKRVAEEYAESIQGKPGQTLASQATANAARAQLLDQRVAQVVKDFIIRGEPKTMIDSYPDLSQDEKAQVCERAYHEKKGRPPKTNPYR